MDDQYLDVMLAQSTPRSAAHSPAVRSEVAEMSAVAAHMASQARLGKQRRRRRLAASSLVASLVLAGAGVAAATGGWWGGQGEPQVVWEDDNCLAGFRVTADGASADEIAVATDVLEQLNYKDLDLEATERDMTASGVLRESDPAGEREHRILSTAVIQQIEVGLAERGLHETGDWGLLGHVDCSGENT